MLALIFSGGRKFFIIPFVFLYIMLVLKTDKNGRKHFVKYTSLVLAFGVICYFLIMNIPVFYNAIGIRMQGAINGLLGEGEQDSSSLIRDKMRLLAIKGWIESPFMGYGFDSFKYLALKELNKFYYSHCNYTELLYNGGIFYFLLYYAIYAKLILDVLAKNKGTQKYRAFALGVAICFLIFDFAGVTYESFPTQLMLAMAISGLNIKEID